MMMKILLRGKSSSVKGQFSMPLNRSPRPLLPLTGAESLREDPLSATSPPHPTNSEVETEATTILSPAPELPPPMQDSLRGFLARESSDSQVEGAQRESLYYYMGAFMSCAYAWHKQSRVKTAQNFSFQALKKEVASLK